MGVSLVLALAVAAGAPADVPLRGATLLRFDVTGDVRVIADPHASSVRVRATSHAGPVPFQLAVTRSGTVVTVRVSGRRPAVFPFSGPSGVAYVLTLPSRTRLEVREHAGNVAIASPLADTSVQNNAGNIAVTHALGTIDVAVDSGNADVQLAPGWHGASIRIQADAGNLQLHVPPAFQGRFDASSGTGRVSNAVASAPHGVPVFVFARTGNVDIDRSPR